MNKARTAQARQPLTAPKSPSSKRCRALATKAVEVWLGRGHVALDRVATLHFAIHMGSFYPFCVKPLPRLSPDAGLSGLSACTDLRGNCLINRCDEALPLPIRDHGKHYAWSFGKRVKGR